MFFFSRNNSNLINFIWFITKVLLNNKKKTHGYVEAYFHKIVLLYESTTITEKKTIFNTYSYICNNKKNENSCLS